MKYIIFVTCFLISMVSQAREPFKIAILDSGFAPFAMDNAVLKLCDKGHYDFNEETETVGEDTHGHGTYVTYLINKNAKSKNICYLIYKVFGPDIRDGHKAIDAALVKAYKAGAKAINMSLYMTRYSHHTRKTIKYMTSKGIKFFVSSGNSNRNLNQKCTNYPVCYKGINKNMMIVGSTDVYGGVASYSNYGARVDVYEMGDINSSRGTSFAAPRALGKYVHSLGVYRK